MSDPSDLIEWLRAQLDDDERIARAVPEPPWAAQEDRSDPDIVSLTRERRSGRDTQVLTDVWRDGMVDYVTRFDPARVLAEIKAKREIIAKHEGAMLQEPKRPDDLMNRGYVIAMAVAVHALALPYADRPGYRPEWRP